jgi:hypothetical protein
MAARLSALRAGRTLPPGFFIFKDLKNPPHRDLNPQPCGLQHSALTTTLPRVPQADAVENPVRGLRPGLFGTSGRRP